MKRDFFPENNIFLMKDGYVYLPLPLSDEVEDNLKKPALLEKDLISTYDRERFVKGLELKSVIESYESLNKEHYTTLRKEAYKSLKEVPSIQKESMLSTLIFDVMPYFVDIRKGNPIDKRSNEELTLELLSKSVKITDQYKNTTHENFSETRNEFILQREMGNGLFYGRNLNQILEDEIKKQIIEKEAKDIKKSIAETERNKLLILSKLAEKDKIEIENFGIMKRGLENYTVYFRTEEFALKDFDGYMNEDYVYVFPPCKIGVDVDKLYVHRPRVLDRYKHPFVPGFESNQTICINNIKQVSKEFTGKNTIEMLNSGVNVILSGYFRGMNHKGYRSLDGRYWGAGYGAGDLNFEDYKISIKDPRIKSGKIKITNEFAFKGRGNYGTT